MDDKIEYDVTISFAGEDRKIACDLANHLRLLGVSTFYDMDESHDLLGRDLYPYLINLYQNKAKYCIIIVSKNYVNKPWCKVERRGAFARMMHDEEYIIPYKIDDVQIEGIPDTTGFADISKIDIPQFAILIQRKLNLRSANVASKANHDTDSPDSKIYNASTSFKLSVTKNKLPPMLLSFMLAGFMVFALWGLYFAWMSSLSLTAIMIYIAVCSLVLSAVMPLDRVNCIVSTKSLDLIVLLYVYYGTYKNTHKISYSREKFCDLIILLMFPFCFVFSFFMCVATGFSSSLFHKDDILFWSIKIPEKIMCPTCGHKLKQKIDAYPNKLQKLVFECNQYPEEHRFEFDPTTMIAVRRPKVFDWKNDFKD